MSPPRYVIPNQTYVITRRCYQRTFRLRPCPVTNQIFQYSLAVAAEKTGVRIHAVCVMSNHHHLVVTDPNGKLPTFLRELHRLTAKALNALHGERENVWAAEPCSAIRLVTDADVAEKIAYVIANPVSAGLVADPSEWPGFITWGERKFEVVQPTAYFRRKGRCPTKVVLEITPPPPRDVARASGSSTKQTARAIRARVTAAHRALRSAGKRFVGRKAVLASSILKRADTEERAWDSVPAFASKLRDVRDRLRRIERAFRTSYFIALAEWRAGRRDVVFPFGTWAMRVVHAARVGPPSPG